MKEQNITINKTREIVYVAKNFTIGVSDFVLTIRRPDGTLFPTVTMTESGESGAFDGIYTATYTPDQLGVWQERITSVSNGDNAVSGYQVVSYDVTDVESIVASVGTQLSAATSTVLADSDSNASSIASIVNSFAGSLGTQITNVDNDVTSVGASLQADINSVGASIVADTDSNAAVIENAITSTATTIENDISIAASAVIADSDSNATTIINDVNSVGASLGVETSTAASTIESTATVIESIASAISNNVGGYIL